MGCDAEGIIVSTCVGGEYVGTIVGAIDLGAMDDGDIVRMWAGELVGSQLGRVVIGACVGGCVGAETVGGLLGVSVGTDPVGFCDGTSVGADVEGDVDGESVGDTEGLFDGAILGIVLVGTDVGGIVTCFPVVPPPHAQQAWDASRPFGAA